MAGMEQVMCKMVDALSEVRDAMNSMQREAGTMRADLDRLRAEVAEMKRKQRFQELATQEARLVFSDAGEARRRLAREAAFEG
jgi:hypothetical protein